MYILGISCFYHDSAVALLKDGELVFAAEEERFVRTKHYYDFPKLAVQAALDYCGITIDDIDYVAFYEKPFRKFTRMIRTFLRVYPRGYMSFMRAIPSWTKRKLWLPLILDKELGYKGKILFVGHHRAHAASAFLVSPFEEAAILTVDGVGEDATTTLGRGKGSQITLTHEIDFPHSLGLLYSTVTAWLGFKPNNGEGKVMGLASYGKPTFREEFRDVIHIADDGSFRLNMKYFDYHKRMRMFSRHFIRKFGPPRSAEDALGETSRNMSATLQNILEEAEIKLAETLYEKTKLDNLCIAGGVGLNSLANWRIARETPFKQVFVQPAAGDSGGALGAVFYAWNCILGNPRKYEMKTAYIGPGFTDDEIEKFLRAEDLPSSKMDEAGIIETAAGFLAEGKIVGWFQGRLEFGPRALCNRSILANPLLPDMKDVLNARVKHRESFRPFAPVIPAEDRETYFDMHINSPFMLLIGDVKADKQKVVPAITHVDGTARVQTLERDHNPLAYDLIRAFERRTGVPVLLNTSFNIRGEPIVCTPEEAFQCFVQTDMDYLFLGNFLLKKSEIGKKELSKKALERISAD
ncbi:MAG: carbamoyltransferase [Planctomycetota bacterium]